MSIKIKKEGRIYEVTWNPNTYSNFIMNEMKITDRIYDGADSYPWIQVFAFLPVKTISGKRVWLRKVYKRKFWAIWGKGFHMEPEVEYGDLFDVMLNPCDGSNNQT